MNKVFMFVAIAAMINCAYADEVGECYKNAENKAQVLACLKLEMKTVKAAYDEVIEQLMAEARGIDRGQQKKVAVKTLTEANKGFEAYIKSECDYVEVTSGNEHSSLACRINMMRLRKADLERRYIVGK